MPLPRPDVDLEDEWENDLAHLTENTEEDAGPGDWLADPDLLSGSEH